MGWSSESSKTVISQRFQVVVVRQPIICPSTIIWLICAELEKKEPIRSMYCINVNFLPVIYYSRQDITIRGNKKKGIWDFSV